MDFKAPLLRMHTCGHGTFFLWKNVVCCSKRAQLVAVCCHERRRETYGFVENSTSACHRVLIVLKGLSRVAYAGLCAGMRDVDIQYVAGTSARCGFFMLSEMYHNWALICPFTFRLKEGLSVILRWLLGRWYKAVCRSVRPLAMPKAQYTFCAKQH